MNFEWMIIVEWMIINALDEKSWMKDELRGLDEVRVLWMKLGIVWMKYRK